MTPQLLLLLSCSAALVASMATTTTPAPSQPGAGASLQEVWAWLSSVAAARDQGSLNINMWMAGNKMSMQVGGVNTYLLALRIYTLSNILKLRCLLPNIHIYFYCSRAI